MRPEAVACSHVPLQWACPSGAGCGAGRHRALDLHAPDGPCVRAHSVVRHCLEVVECVVGAFYATVLGGGQLRRFSPI